MVRNQSWPINNNNNNNNHSYSDVILYCSNRRDWWRISDLVVDKEKKLLILGLVGGIILFIYGTLPTFQPSNFGRVYASYGGIFLVSSIIWGLLKQKDEVIGSFIVLSGAAVMFYSSR